MSENVDVWNNFSFKHLHSITNLFLTYDPKNIPKIRNHFQSHFYICSSFIKMGFFNLRFYTKWNDNYVFCFTKEE